MDTTREDIQRQEFRNILLELAKSQIELGDKTYRAKIYKRLEALYHVPDQKDGFRHYYSDIFTVLTQIQQGNFPGSIEILGQNLSVVRKGYQALNRDEEGTLIDISDSIRKLYDHVSLDIARINFSNAEDRHWAGAEEITDLKTQVNTIQSDLIQKQHGLLEDVKNVKHDLHNSQKEYITILGIFAAVVLSFTGGIVYSTSVFNNIAQVSIYRTILIALVIGLVLVNILFGLFYYINKLVNKGNPLRPLIISNAIFILLIIATVVFWIGGVVESRNSRIENTNQTLCIQIEESVESVK